MIYVFLCFCLVVVVFCFKDVFFSTLKIELQNHAKSHCDTCKMLATVCNIFEGHSCVSLRKEM